jgi:regulator of sigma E protease
VGDRLLSIDGTPLIAWAQVLRIVAGSADGQKTARTLSIGLGRAGERVDLRITPDMVEDTDAIGRQRIHPILGVTRDGEVIDTEPIVRRYGAWTAFTRAVDRTVWLTGATAAQIGRIITGEVAPAKSLGGPVEIVRQAKKAAEEGIYRWASLMGMLSISLGLINLLPVPVLDGGQLLFYGIEVIRGRPVSVRIREMAQQVGVLLLMALMLFVLVVDVNRCLGAL